MYGDLCKHYPSHSLENLMTSTPTVDTTALNWSVRVAWCDYDEDHRYGYSEWYKVNGAQENVPVWAEKTYGTGSRNSAVAHQLSLEMVHTSETFGADGRVMKRVVTTEVTDFTPVYREFEEYSANVLAPQAAYQKAREESGEEALWDAHIAESNQNVIRRENGEAPVYDAEKAFYTFQGYSLPVHNDEVQPKQNFLTRLFHS
jgi:hypothetical protein